MTTIIDRIIYELLINALITINFAWNPINGGIPAEDSIVIKIKKAKYGCVFDSPDRSVIFSIPLLLDVIWVIMPNDASAVKLYTTV